MYELVDIFLFVSGVHGILLFFVLIFWKRNRSANRLFSFLILIVALNFFNLFFDFSEMNNSFSEAMDFVPCFMYGPLVYLYVKVLTAGKESLSCKNFFHFIPAFGDIFFRAVESFIFPVGLNGKGDFLPVVLEDVQTLLYLGISMVVLVKFRKGIFSFFSDTDRMKLRWLNLLIVLLALFRFYSLCEVVMISAEIAIPESVDNISLVAESLFIYAISYMVLAQREIFDDVLGVYQGNSSAEGDEKYSNTGLNEKMAEEYTGKLLTYMEEEAPYRRSDLTLSGLAYGLNISPHHLSQIINSRMNMNFYSFVNNYRVEEACRQLESFDRDNSTILSIAYDVGFNSKTTFNEVFKKNTGKTPTQYLKENPLKSDLKDKAKDTITF